MARDAGPAAPARPLRRDAELNRRRILASAREVFGRRGLEATLDDIAHHAGLGVGTVYRRFPSKEALLEVALEERLEQHAQAAEAALRAPTAWAGLTAFLRDAAEMHAADRGLRDVALGAEIDLRQFARMRDRVVPVLEQLIERGQAEGTLRPDVTVEDLPLLMMMISEVANHSHTIRPDIYRRYLQLLLDGLRPSPDSGDLGRPLSADDVEALARKWMPGPHRASRT